jgi:hypothetical protein
MTLCVAAACQQRGRGPGTIDVSGDAANSRFLASERYRTSMRFLATPVIGTEQRKRPEAKPTAVKCQSRSTQKTENRRIFPIDFPVAVLLQASVAKLASWNLSLLHHFLVRITFFIQTRRQPSLLLHII